MSRYFLIGSIKINWAVDIILKYNHIFFNYFIIGSSKEKCKLSIWKKKDLISVLKINIKFSGNK